RGEVVRKYFGHDHRGPGHADQGVVMDLLPLHVVSLAVSFLEVLVLPAAVEREFKLCGFLLLGEARPLEHLPVKNGGNGRGRTLRELFRAEVEKHDRRGVFFCDGAQGGRNLVAGKPVAKEVKERLSLDGPRRVERRPEVLGERALAASVEAGDPYPDLRDVSPADAFT